MRALAIGVALVCAGAAPALADLQSGRDKFVHGDYDGARADLERVRGADRNRAKLLLVRLDMRLGRWAQAAKGARSLLRARPPVANDARAALAEIQFTTGDDKGARKTLDALLAKDAFHLRGRLVQGRLLLSQGKHDQAEKVFESFIRDHYDDKLTLDDARHAMYLALATRYLRSIEDANDAFREAVQLDPQLLEANIEWGKLFLSNYSAANAEQSFDDVLKIDAKHPDAHAGMARVAITDRYDVAAARHHVEQALATNPQHTGALLVRAEIEINSNDYDAAKATLGQVFAVDAGHLEALALLATTHWLRDETPEYEKVKRKVMALNPRYDDLYHIIARSAEREHRYQEAIALEEQAVALDPRAFVSMAAIGTGYLRLGEEKKGVEWLLRAWEGDQYNARTKNILDLFEQVIPRQYVFGKSRHFRVRYHKDEQPLLERYVEPLMETAYGDMVKRYGFTPAGPLTVELYRDPDHYSVRTVGLPNLGALGVCFGKVITSMSPSGGNINWAQVLWHELGHVFAIQMSRSRVPRWYTEGLSEYETVIARPEWRRENDGDLYDALVGGTLPSVADLNQAFTSTSMQGVLVAYHLSSVVIEYIATTHGFKKVVRGLELYGKGYDTPRVIESITGMKVPAFDAAFRVWLRKRLSAYATGFRLPAATGLDRAKLEAAAKSAPRDANAQAQLALARYYEGDAAGVGRAAKAALAIDADNKLALLLMGELALAERDADGAERNFTRLIAVGGDGYDAREKLGVIALQKKDVAAAENHFNRAKTFDPERSYPYEALAELFEKNGRHDDSLRELAEYARIEQMQYAPLATLVKANAARSDWKAVRRYGERAVEVNPFDANMLVTLGEAYLQTKAASKALFAFDSALLARPRLKRPAEAHAGRARALLALGDKRKARAAVKEALRLEPKNESALGVSRKLRRR